MAQQYMLCPKCGYQRNQYDKLIHHDVCPACGIVYSKWQARQEPEPQFDELAEITDDPLPIRIYGAFKAQFFSVPDRVDSLTFYGRVGLFCLLFLWGWSFILGGINWQSIGNSFLHNVNLPFHEFGHLLFMPLGRFWHILGGSLFQILLPLLLLLVFAVRQRDNYAASVMLWWAGQSCIDISPYIADAQQRAIPLIAGLGEESHDWGNLLTMSGNLQHTDSIALSCFILGSVGIISSNIWAAYLLIKQRKVIE